MVTDLKQRIFTAGLFGGILFYSLHDTNYYPNIKSEMYSTNSPSQIRDDFEEFRDTQGKYMATGTGIGMLSVIGHSLLKRKKR